MTAKPMLVTVKNDKLCLAQEGEDLVTLDEKQEYIVNAKDEDDVLALFDGGLGLIKREEGVRWDGQNIDTSDLAKYEEQNEVGTTPISEPATVEENKSSDSI